MDLQVHTYSSTYPQHDDSSIQVKMLNCGAWDTTGSFTTTGALYTSYSSGSNATRADLHLRALVVETTGRIERVDCLSSYMVACCGPE